MLLAPAAAVLRRDLIAHWRRRGDLISPLLFALMVTTLLPLALGPEAQRLTYLAGGMVWVTVLLAGLLTLDSVFRADAEDGSLDQLLLSPAPLSLLVLAKLLAHWLVTGLPLTLIAPLLGLMLQLPQQTIGTLTLSLLLGTPLLSLIGGVCAALTVGLRRSGILLALLVLPLYVPVLIFGAGAVDAALAAQSATQPLLLLGSGLLLAFGLAPLACAVALRLGTT